MAVISTEHRCFSFRLELCTFFFGLGSITRHCTGKVPVITKNSTNCLVNLCPYMNPFSWLAFSNFFLIIGPSFRKKGCCHGRAVVPGPLVLEYSREIASAFLYTANETNKRQIQINAKKLKCNYMLSLFKSNSFDFYFHSFVRWVVQSFIQSINPAVSQSVSQSVHPSV